MSAPVDHPPPWKWLGRPDEETALLDGEGYSILSPSNDGGISIRSSYVREVVRAAPEMAKLLDWFAEMGDWIQPVHPNLAKARALLKRLDAARKAGG